MKQILRKRKKFFIIIIVIIILAVLMIMYFNNKRNNRILYKFSYENYAWSACNYGYYIYFNGKIEEFDYYNKERTLKSSRISANELIELKKLANMVEDSYQDDTSRFYMADAGVSIRQIYSSKLSKWVILSKGGNINGKNPTENSKKILELTDKLYKKYLKK